VTVALDTSVAVPFPVRSHQHRAEVVRWWDGPLVLSGPRARPVHATLSRLGIALAAMEHGVALATRDARARGTYDALGIKVILVA
jgi:hypothetical protein